jgi:outer membrane scaffolding protein for murein synthesis (MipA/OmpV family)
VYAVPGRDDLLMRTNGALYAVFDQSTYTRDPQKRGAMRAVIPAATVFYIGRPDFRTIRSTGMRDLDWTLGLGLGAGVNRKSWRAFAEVRAGVKGYSGLTARAGADLLWAPSPQTVLAVGPRIDLVGGDYAKTWFGVTPAEAAASGGRLAAYAPDGGLASAGLAASWGRALNDRAMLQVEAGWDRRLGEVADSPLVRKGSRDAVTLSTGLTWRFGFGGS